MAIIDIIGWTGALLLSICGLPQAIKSYKEKHSNGISWWFLSLWGIGELLTLIYVLPTLNAPLIVNYSLNMVFIGIIIYYKWK